MDLDSVKVRPLESDGDVEEELALMRLAFPGERVDEMVERLLTNHPGFNRSSFLTIRQGGMMVASLCMIPVTWSIGGVALRVVEMGMVATHPDYRRRGLQRLLNSEYDKITAAEGYDLSVIEGIPYFYRQFNYEYTIPLDSEVKIPIEKLPEYEAALCLRAFKEEDIPAAMELMEESSDRFMVRGIRPSEVWRAQQRTNFHADRQFDGYVVEESGKMVAYFRVERKTDCLYLLEASYLSNKIGGAILGYLKVLGSEAKATKLISRLSHEDALTRELVAEGGEVNRPYGWQVKVVDHQRLFRKMLPLLNRRLSESQDTNLPDKIRINLYKRCLALIVEGGEVKRIEPCEGQRNDNVLINPVVLPKLLLGIRSVKELMAEYPDVMITPRYQGIFDTLFPKGFSHIDSLY